MLEKSGLKHSISIRAQQICATSPPVWGRCAKVQRQEVGEAGGKGRVDLI